MDVRLMLPDCGCSKALRDWLGVCDVVSARRFAATCFPRICTRSAGSISSRAERRSAAGNWSSGAEETQLWRSQGRPRQRDLRQR